MIRTQPFTFQYRLAGGTAGVQAGINETLVEYNNLTTLIAYICASFCHRVLSILCGCDIYYPAASDFHLLTAGVHDPHTRYSGSPPATCDSIGGHGLGVTTRFT